jgi:hypothetical protein
MIILTIILPYLSGTYSDANHNRGRTLSALCNGISDSWGTYRPIRIE